MARLFTSGFELNSITDGIEFTTNSAPVSISTTNVRSGTYAGRVNAGVGFWRQVLFTTNQTTIGYIGVAIYIVAAPNATTQLLRFSTALNGLTSNISINTTRTLVLQNGSGVQIGSASAALNLNQWYYIELKQDSGGTFALEGRLDGVAFATGVNSATNAWARALIGNITGAQTTNDIYFDDWKVNDSTGSSQTGYPGSGKVIMLSPNATGDANGWLVTAGTAGTTSNYTLVDEIPPNDATDFVQTGTLNAEDFYNMSASGTGSGDTINVVQIGSRFRNDVADATAAFKTEVRKTTAGTISQGTAIIPNLITWKSFQTAATDVYVHTLYADPDAAAWTGGTGGTLDSMQVGVKLTAANVNKIQVTSVWAYVDYTPVTTIFSYLQLPNQPVFEKNQLNGY